MSLYVKWMVLAQFLVVVIAFVAVGVVLKISGYPSSDFVRWNGVAVAFREHGPWLLLFPVGWGIYALVCEHYNRGLLSEAMAGTIGVLFLTIVVILFLYAICVPFTRSMLLEIHPRSPSATKAVEGH